MNESLPLVRLTKDEQWAVCADVSCGERFAMRTENTGGVESESLDGAEQASDVPSADLDFLPGWYRHGDTWTMSGRARTRLSQGLQPAFRRAPFLVTRATGSVSREIDESGREALPRISSSRGHCTWKR